MGSPHEVDPTECYGNRCDGSCLEPDPFCTSWLSTNIDELNKFKQHLIEQRCRSSAIHIQDVIDGKEDPDEWVEEQLSNLKGWE